MRQSVMIVVERTLHKFITSKNHCPFDDWFNSLKDKKTQATIDARLTRLRRGNFGDCKTVGFGVKELRIDFGPGYRVYFSEVNHKIVLLLVGGTKRNQRNDIKIAQGYWAEYVG